MVQTAAEIQADIECAMQNARTCVWILIKGKSLIGINICFCC